MRLGGNDGIAAKYIPAFAALAMIFAVLLLGNSIWASRVDILAWTSTHVLGTGLIFSLLGFGICLWLALFGRDD